MFRATKSIIWLVKPNYDFKMFLLSNLRELSKKLKKAKTKCLFSNKLLRIGGIKYIQKIKYILEWNLLEKSAKRPFCCTVSILQVYFTYLCYITCWALEYHFIENLKLFDQWSFHIDSMPFTLQTMIFRYNYKSNDVFIHLIHYKVYLTV